MRSEDLHLSDHELLQAADGELPARRASQIHVHLAACWDCRARMAEIEATIGDFARGHRQALDSQLPSIDGPRALLRAQLAELASKPVSPWRQLFRFNSPVRTAALVGTAFLLFFVAAMASKFFFQNSLRAANSAMFTSERGAVPNHSLTPGATRRVTVSDVCSLPREQVIAEVSAPLRQEVFREYGIVNARASDYEIDYLIAPGLGGVGEIHNLWPEPYSSPIWNARVKDDLEEHLHEMVCAGKLDLATAQGDIATDWIAAYKKYFHTDTPLTFSSRLTSALSSLPLR
jgi:hypothetical protein